MRQNTVKIKLFAQMMIGVTDECQILMYSIIEHAAQPHSNSDDMLKLQFDQQKRQPHYCELPFDTKSTKLFMD